MGDLKSVLRSAGSAVASAAKKTAAGAVQGAGQSIGQSLRDWISPGSKGGGRPGAPAPNYLPWILGGAAALGVGYMVLGRRR